MFAKLVEDIKSCPVNSNDIADIERLRKILDGHTFKAKLSKNAFGSDSHVHTEDLKYISTVNVHEINMDRDFGEAIHSNDEDSSGEKVRPYLDIQIGFTKQMILSALPELLDPNVCSDIAEFSENAVRIECFSYSLLFSFGTTKTKVDCYDDDQSPNVVQELVENFTIFRDAYCFPGILAELDRQCMDSPISTFLIDKLSTYVHLLDEDNSVERVYCLFEQLLCGNIFLDAKEYFLQYYMEPFDNSSWRNIHKGNWTREFCISVAKEFQITDDREFLQKKYGDLFDKQNRIQKMCGMLWKHMDMGMYVGDLEESGLYGEKMLERLENVVISLEERMGFKRKSVLLENANSKRRKVECTVCGICMKSTTMKNHLKTKSHIKRLKSLKR